MYDTPKATFNPYAAGSGTTAAPASPHKEPTMRHPKLIIAGTGIAAQAGMTTQSMGELVDDLVTKGYLRRQEDPADRRAKRIYLTGKGRQAADAGHAATRTAEQQLQAALGPLQYRQLRRNLAAIAHLGL